MLRFLHNRSQAPHGGEARWHTRAREPALTILLVIEIFAIFVFIPQDGLAVYALRSGHGLIVSLVVVTAVALIAPGRNALLITLFVTFLGLIADFSRYEWSSKFSTCAFIVVVILFVTVLTAVVGRVVFGPGRVTAHRIQGALVVYLHVAVIFTFLYAIVLFFAPGAFGSALATTDPSVGAKLLYFSLTTLTTVGYGDITPVHPYARSLANLEAIIGQLYPATLLARLVTLEVEMRRK